MEGMPRFICFWVGDLDLGSQGMRRFGGIEIKILTKC